MDRKEHLTFAQARDLDLVNYLDQLGLDAPKIKGNNYWYHSPFRNERTPSFKVNINMNRWFDFGEGVGGSIVDLVMMMQGCSAFEALKQLSSNSASDFVRPVSNSNDLREKEAKIGLLKVGEEIRQKWLLKYLTTRGISLEIASNYLRQITYKVNRRTYTSLGLQNQSGGWELRSPYFKGSSSPKDLTYLNNGYQTLCVFEGIFDFLSFVQIFGLAGIEVKFDFIILNSIVFFQKAHLIMGAYEQVHFYLDNDDTGKRYLASALEQSSKFIDKSNIYKDHKDLNGLLCHTSAEQIASTFFIKP